VIFKIISKAYATCLGHVANRIISPNHTAFIKGKKFDGTLTLIEIVHELCVKELGGLSLNSTSIKPTIG
jgi:hypothetical protein